MKTLLLASGKMKDASPEALLMREYIKRLPWNVSVKECEPGPKESAFFLKESAQCHKIIALDERGKDLSSRELAAQFSKWQQQGASSIALIIGGADGLTDDVREKADLLLAFGRATWPHMLVRAMLAEQLYRAHTIIEKHPYHRD